MNDPENYDADARFLAEMLSPDAGEEVLGGERELAAILRHQLDAPLALDLDSLGPESRRQADDLSRRTEPPIHTFRDLVSHPHPPVELLELTKNFARSCVGHPRAAVPEKVADVLYTLSIVVAATRCERRITELDDEYVRRRIDWALSRPWLDETAREILAKACPSFSGPSAVDTPASATSNTALAAASGEPLLSMSASHASLGQLGEYTLLQKLGEGGMGTVYKALHVELDRLVALKVMRHGPVEEDWAEARFRREIRAVGALDHPNIVRAYDARRIDGTHFLVMEYVAGLDLTELIRRLNPVAGPASSLPLADACELVRQAALGLQCAHENGLVHRDIKPSNLMLSRQGLVKILDLGLARMHAAPGSEMTTIGQVMGTPDYMAPEQISNSHDVDIRADIYSLGCTFYTLLIGRPPFSGPEYQGLLAKMSAHRDQTPLAVSRFRSDVPDALIAVLDRMLAKNSTDRFAAPVEVANALEPWTHGSDLKNLLATAESGQPGTNKPAEPRQMECIRDNKVARRRYWIAAASLLLLIVASGVTWMVIHREDRDAVPTTVSGPENPTAISSRANVTTASGPSIPPGWIALSWTRPRMGKLNLWLFSPDGKQRLNITSDPRYFDIHPKFSPDARRIAFIRGEGLTDPNGIYVCKPDGTEMRQVVAPRDKSERFIAPVWVSNSRIYYTRDPKPDRQPDMELWYADLDGSEPHLVGRFQDIVGKGDGLVTDVSPDGRHLVILAQNAGSPASSDVYVIDVNGKNLEAVWVDRPDEWRDARALWSPDGTRIAWHHNFARGVLGKSICYGVGMARRGADGTWNARLQPQAETFVTPLAWAPRGDCLLCARMQDLGQKLRPATLFLMDGDFRTAGDLCELEATPWQPAQRDLGRLADWAIIPADIKISATK